jgi:FixJ family two-component response regulator
VKPTSTVFVVDDEEPLRHAFEILLSTQGIAVRTFSSAEAFLQVYRDDWVGCLFTDARMPNMSGLELCRELHNRKTSLTIVLMTGHESRDSVQELIGTELELTVLEKPFSAEAMKACLSNAGLMQTSKPSAKSH